VYALKMVSVNVEMDETGVRFAFDASNLNEDGIKEAVAKTFGKVQRTLLKRSDVRNMRALNSTGITVYLDPETRQDEARSGRPPPRTCRCGGDYRRRRYGQTCV